MLFRSKETESTDFSVILDPFGRAQAFYEKSKFLLPFQPAPVPDITQAKIRGYSDVSDYPSLAQVEKYLNADLKVCTLPEEPYDQVVGIMLLCKLNAVAEGRLHVDDITIGSSMSDGVSCMIGDDEFLGPFEMNGWWKECSTKINDVAVKRTSKKVVKLIKPGIDWSDVYLTWEEKKPKKDVKPNTEILFGKIGRAHV